MTFLVCYPCPYQSVCCTWGVSLSDAEAAQLLVRHGPQSVEWCEEEDGYRTAIQNGRCYFSQENRCLLHEEPYYPQICRGFPASDGQGAPYVHDTSICPALSQETP